ncbi:MAG: hypothetical protein KKA79_09570 [Nanoarchaeota archaeon]|nr:hypothetical protein [Nanoarchaeota archaeon]
MAIKSLDYLSKLEKVVEAHLSPGSVKEHPIKLVNRSSRLNLLANPIIDGTEIVVPHKINKFKMDNQKDVMSLNLLTNFLCYQRKRYQEASGVSRKVEGLNISSFFNKFFYKKLLEIHDNQNVQGFSHNENPKLLMHLFDTVNTYVMKNNLFKEYKGLEAYFKENETPSKAAMYMSRGFFKPAFNKFISDFENMIYYYLDTKIIDNSYSDIMKDCQAASLKAKDTKDLMEIVPMVKELYDIMRDNFHITKFKSPKKRFNPFAMKSPKLAAKNRDEIESKRRSDGINDLFGFSVGSKVANLITSDDVIAIHNIQDAMRKLFLNNYGDHLDTSGEDIDMEEWMHSEMEYEATKVRETNDIFILDDDDKTSIATAVLADVSPSTADYKIFIPIKRSMIIYTKAIANCNFLDPSQKIDLGLYTFAKYANTVQGFDEKITPETYNKIAAITTGSWTQLHRGLEHVYNEIKPINAKKKLVTIITDGATEGVDYTKAWLRRFEKEHIYPVLIVIGGDLEEYAINLMGGGDGIDKPYSIIERGEIYKLGDELLRMFNRYGMCSM